MSSFANRGGRNVDEEPAINQMQMPLKKVCKYLCLCSIAVGNPFVLWMRRGRRLAHNSSRIQVLWHCCAIMTVCCGWSTLPLEGRSNTMHCRCSNTLSNTYLPT